MKKEYVIILALTVLTFISLFISVKLTGSVISEFGETKIELNTPESTIIEAPYELIAYCEPELGCQKLAFYYFSVENKFNEKGEFEGAIRAKNISDFKTLCNNVKKEENFFMYREEKREQANMYRFSCILNFEGKEYGSDFLEVIAIGKDKDNKQIVSNTGRLIIGRTRENFEKLQKMEDYGPIALIIIAIILTVVDFWLAFLISSKLDNRRLR